MTADTLKRRARKGQLRVYKPGKAFLSTLADVWAMVEATRTGPPAAVSNQIDPSATEVSHAALEQARATLRHSEEERREAEWERKYDARKAARAKTRPPRTPKKR